jgi:hypothetical protein
MLKRLVADLSLDKPRLSEALRKKSKARTLQRTGRLVLRHLSGQLQAGPSAGPGQWRRLVSAKPREGSVRAADVDSHSRSRPCPAPIWVSADRVLLRREGWLVNRKRVRRLYRLEGLQRRMRVRRRKHNGAAPWSGSNLCGTGGALEHELCAWYPGEWTALPSINGRR